MSVSPVIRCNCGQRIMAKDVMQTGWYMRHLGPSFVYVKFRCSRCKKLGEQFVKHDDWEDGILRDVPSELDRIEKKRLDALGPITVHEQIDAHFRLEDPKLLSSLRMQIQMPERRRPRTRRSPRK